MAHAWWLGFVAVLAGWIVTETGRQPWIAHGILRTADAISPVPGASVASTLALFVLVYGVVFTMGIYYINRLIVQRTRGRSDRAARHARAAQPAIGGAGSRARSALAVTLTQGRGTWNGTSR